MHLLMCVISISAEDMNIKLVLLHTFLLQPCNNMLNCAYETSSDILLQLGFLPPSPWKQYFHCFCGDLCIFCYDLIQNDGKFKVDSNILLRLLSIAISTTEMLDVYYFIYFFYFSKEYIHFSQSKCIDFTKSPCNYTIIHN